MRKRENRGKLTLDPVVEIPESGVFMKIGNNVLNEEIFYEVRQYLYPIVKRKALILISLIMIALGAFLFFLPKLVPGTILIVFGVLILLETLTLRGKAARQAVAQIREVTGKDHCTYVYTFTEEAIFVQCTETNAREKIPLDHIARTAQTKHTLILFTKTSRMVILRRDQMGEEKTEQLLKYLEENCASLNQA